MSANESNRGLKQPLPKQSIEEWEHEKPVISKNDSKSRTRVESN